MVRKCKGIKETLKYGGCMHAYTSTEVSVRVKSYTCTIGSHYTVSACLNMLICCQIFSIVTMADLRNTNTDFSGHISIFIPKPESAWLLKVLTYTNEHCRCNCIYKQQAESLYPSWLCVVL